MQLFWGDLHSHCAISYGHGTVTQALARARQQLDFCSITGHAFWPDMPTDRVQYGDIIDYHREGFATCARNWAELIRLQKEASVPGEFIAFPSYEWHSLKYGDHNVYGMGPDLPLRDAPDLVALRELAHRSGALIIPHHIGYAAGYRGINWRHYDPSSSPFVEIYSLHGSSESEDSAYPMLHSMGPRDQGSTADHGWASGHRFGVVGGTDHHGGYPGSHGDGMMGVFAKDLSRESIWQAFRDRRVYAVTGDKIDARLFVDDAWMGETVKNGGKRRVRAVVRGVDKLDRVEVLKNGRIMRRFFPPVEALEAKAGRYRLRIVWGWGRKTESAFWQGRLTVSNGSITSVDTCFSGQAVVGPKGAAGHAQNADEEDLPHQIVEQRADGVSWVSTTQGNLSMRHPRMQALSLELDLRHDSQLELEVNGQSFSHSMEDLLMGGRVHYLRGWLSEAVRMGPLVPLASCEVETEFEDQPEWDVDVYRLRAAQTNGQWAWLTPVWVER